MMLIRMMLPLSMRLLLSRVMLSFNLVKVHGATENGLRPSTKKKPPAESLAKRKITFVEKVENVGNLSFLGWKSLPELPPNILKELVFRPWIVSCL